MEEMKIGTIEGILDAPDVAEKVVPVPARGCSVKVK